MKYTWVKWWGIEGRRRLLAAAKPTAFFIDTKGIPSGFRVGLYECGADPSGCAALRGFFYTIREAKAAAIRRVNPQLPLCDDQRSLF